MLTRLLEGKSYYARNVGARASAGKCLAFCDADDEVTPGWVAEIGGALSQHDVVHGQMRFDKFNSPEQAEHWSRLWKDGLYREQFLPHAGGANIGVRRSVHEAICGFDECLPRFADGDYSWRLQLEGYTLHYCPRAIYQYRLGRVNPSLAYLFRRSWTAPACDYWLYKKYRSLGIKKEMVVPAHRSLKRSLISWLRLIENIPCACLKSRDTRDKWIREFVMQSGDLYGQFWGRLSNPCKAYSLSGKSSVKIPSSC